MRKINYYLRGKRKTIFVKQVSVYSTGLLFKNTSPPLLFEWKSERTFSIFSIFCKPFVALWLDENMRVTKRVRVMKWKWNIRGRGKYLLEIPLGDALVTNSLRNQGKSRREM